MLTLTKRELEEALENAIETVLEDEADGDISHLARMLGVHPNIVRGWSQRGRISKKGAKIIVAHPALGKKYDLKFLRPDIDE